MHDGGAKGRTPMIKSLSLSNFKSFGEEQILPLAPLTLIFGKNSSGKSSVIQSLLFIKQSFENILEGYPPRLVGDDVDLLSIKHTLHSQGKDISKNTIKIGILLSESFNTGLLTRRVNRRAMNPVRLPTIPLGMTFGWTWDHTAAAVSNSTWEVLIDDHNPAVFSGNLGNRIDVPKTYDKSSKYIHATYKAYGKLLSHAHKKNINDWIAVFNREDLQNFRTCMSRLNPVEAERTRTQISYLRWVNPELMHRFESQVSGSPLSLDEILSACFTKWFNITTNTNNKDSINFKSTNDDNQEETPPQDIDDGVTKTLGPQLKKESVIQESNLSNTEIIFEDIYTEIPIYLKDYFLTIHDSFDWYTEQYNIIHFDNFEHTRNSVADEIIRYATMSDALGMAVNPEVGDFLSVTPVHWTASASRSLDRLFSSLRHVTPVRDQLQRAYLDAAASTPVQSTESSSRPRYGRMRPTGSASDERAASSLAVFRASLRDADTRDLVNRALAQLEIPYEIIINREPVRAHEGIITESIILRDRKSVV